MCLDLYHFAILMQLGSIVPLHSEGWARFSEGREKIAKVLPSAGLATRLLWSVPGKTIRVEQWPLTAKLAKSYSIRFAGISAPFWCKVRLVARPVLSVTKVIWASATL